MVTCTFQARDTAGSDPAKLSQPPAFAVGRGCIGGGSPSGRPRQRQPSRGFTLVEALVSTSILAITGAAVLLGIANSIDSTDSNLELILAAGMGQQLMDEIAGQRYCEPGGDPYSPTLGPDAGEQAGPGRSLFDDIDDYQGYACQPPTDRWGQTLGTDNGQGSQRPAAMQPASGYFRRWHQTVSVYYVSNADLTTPLAAGFTSNYRAVRVRILVDDLERGPLVRADLTRVFAYVPSS
jgi:type II secretory pathway pseudopilin PulG